MNVRKKSETTSVYEIEWDSVPNAEEYIGLLDGSEFLIDGKRHFTFDKTVTSMKFGKPQDSVNHSYGVKALAAVDSGSVSDTPIPPPPPPPPVTTALRNTYIDPWWRGSNPDYSKRWDTIHPRLTSLTSMMAPLDVSVVNHVGAKHQWCLVPNGITEAEFIQYGKPCWDGGLVDGFVTKDEPDPSSQTIQNCLSVRQIVERNCKQRADGTNVLTMVTGYDSGTLKVLAAHNVSSKYGVDNYPNRTGWDLNGPKGCVSVLEAAKVPYIIVVGAFTDGTKDYPMPTPDQLRSYIQWALTTKADGISIYACGDCGDLSNYLENDEDLVAVINELL